MKGTLLIDTSIPAKLIVQGKEIDVELIRHSYKETEYKNFLVNSLKEIEETFVCVKRTFIKND